MTIQQMQELLEAEVLLDNDLPEKEVNHVFCSDMMSDVLAFAEGTSVLITGLCNPQVIRTAEMIDIICIIFVRGKKPDEKILAMAKDRDIVILSTRHQMFSACGILYTNGLSGGE